MNQKEKPVLSDREVIPTDNLIFSIIGGKKKLWQSVISYASENNIIGSWNYYLDGKQWLFKAVHKKKTIFWAAILQDTFRVTFYFGDKAEPVIDTSELPESIKEGFRTGKRYGKIRAISLKVSNISDIDIIKKLIDIKSKLK